MMVISTFNFVEAVIKFEKSKHRKRAFEKPSRNIIDDQLSIIQARFFPRFLSWHDLQDKYNIVYSLC